MGNAVSFCNVIKTYAKNIGEKTAFTALKDVSFDIKEGCATSIIGANGAGKSTVIKHIIGLLSPTSGTLSVFDEEVNSSSVNANRLGYLPEVVSFNNSLSVYDNILFSAKLYRMSNIKYHIDLWLDKMNIKEIKNRSVNKISKGQRQRVAFICSVIHDPEFIILDEPMSGLDPIGRSLIINAIYDLKNRGVTLLICSHLLDDIQKFTDNVILMHFGRVIENCTLNSILEHKRNKSLEDYYIKTIEKIKQC